MLLGDDATPSRSGDERYLQRLHQSQERGAGSRKHRTISRNHHRPFRVQGARLHQGRALLTLHGIADRSAAEAWRGVYVYVSREDALPLEENQYYHYQIIGLQAVTEEGEALGRISEVLTTGANDVYVIQGPRGEILLPAYQDVILHVDRASGRMVVRIPEGLV